MMCLFGITVLIFSQMILAASPNTDYFVNTTSNSDRITYNGQTNITAEEGGPIGNGTKSTFNETELINLNITSNKTETNMTEVTNETTTVLSTIPTNVGGTPDKHHSMFGEKVGKKVCGCDLTFGSCDINCCCDVECTQEESLAFNRCEKQLSSPNLRFCVQSSLMYKNNAPYKENTRSSRPNLFCIVRDNFKQRYDYKTPPDSKSPDDLKSKSMKNHFSWNQNEEHLRKPVMKEMKVGSQLYRVSSEEKRIEAWAFPASLFSAQCQVMEDIQYLKNQHSACSIALDVSSHIPPCTHNSFKASSYYGFHLLKSLALFNESFNAQTDLCHENNTCVLVVPSEKYICFDESDVPRICYTTNSDGHLPSPKFNKTSGTCYHIVRKVTYQIEHNGIMGLVNVTASFELGTINAKANYVTQEFVTTYLWASRSNESHVRSGNPGYLIGRPVLAGKKTISNETDEASHILVMNKDERNWLTILRSHHNGLCTEIPENRAPVNFGENLMSGCILKVTPQTFQSCEHLQQLILLLINGTRQPDHIGTFGNSNIHNMSDWVPIQFENVPTAVQPTKFMCQSIITGLHIDIYHAATGTLSDPQHKIIATLVRYHNRLDIDLKCQAEMLYICKQDSTIVLTSSVSFLDVSQPAIQSFGQPPSLRASVPTDFFYPFTTASHGHCIRMPDFFLYIIVICLLCYCYTFHLQLNFL